MDEGMEGDHKEKIITPINGTNLVLINTVVLILALALIPVIIFIEMFWLFAVVGIIVLVNIVIYTGFFEIEPNTCYICTFCGKYIGTVRNCGFWWVNPFYSKLRMSLRLSNFETGMVKCNDAIGNPINIQAVIVWRLFDSAQALFEVENYRHYMMVQSEAALRAFAAKYPLEPHAEDQVSLRSHPFQISDDLRDEIQKQLGKAGIQIVEAKISYLAYSNEIAQAMLRKQQAKAVIMARKQIVSGACGMIKMALEELAGQNIATLSNSKKQDMVGNMLVVLCGEEKTKPILSISSN